MTGAFSRGPAFAGALLCALLPSALWSQAVEARTLPNGLLIVAITTAPRTLDVTTAYFAGYRDEHASHRGLAHLMEHLAMRETTSSPSIAAELHKAGISAGASTSAAFTAFNASSPDASASALGAILHHEALRMGELALLPSTIDAERRRIQIEVAGSGRADTVSAAGVLFAGSRLASVSSHDGLSRIDHASLKTFYDRFYGPANCMIVISSPLPAREVLGMAGEILGGVRSRMPAPPRPVHRDSVRIVHGAYRAAGGAGSGTAVASFAAPGIQHRDRPLLERELARWQQELESVPPESAAVRVELTADAPASVIRIRATAGDHATAARVLQRVLDDKRRASAAPALAPRSARLTPSALIACEAAGDWRYCLGSAQDSATMGRERTLLSGLLADLPDRTALWPSALREPPEQTSPSTPAAAVASAGAAEGWTSPSWGERWLVSTRGIRWTSASGGIADSAAVAASFTPDLSRASHVDVAALEVLARIFGSLRIGGTMLRDTLAALGAAPTIRSLPYPPLATTDAFRTLGVAPTPIGLLALELAAVVPRGRAGAVLHLLTNAIGDLEVDSAAFEAERARQQRLLAEAAREPNARAETTFRHLVGSERARGMWQPQPLEAQLRTMNELHVRDVRAMLERLPEPSSMRLVLLGADTAEASEWLGASSPNRAGAGEGRRGGASCSARAPDAPDAPPPATSVFVAACLPWGNGSSVPPAAAIANALIGGREDAALARRLRGETGLAYDFESRMIPVHTEGTTIWQLRAGTKAGDADTVVAEVRSVLTQLLGDERLGATIEEFREWLAVQRLGAARDPRRWAASVLWNGYPPDRGADMIRSTPTSEVVEILRALSTSPLLTVPAVRRN
ncbi:MAG TPA: insulinase family protein [Longimicrobium sp.]|jgi:hypothetical protein|uniref:M16 family metallopeptidase n=1 Tax=Longimicrobium sp. TaxID=2029185 RepID=UPI002EDA7B54